MQCYTNTSVCNEDYYYHYHSETSDSPAQAPRRLPPAPAEASSGSFLQFPDRQPQRPRSQRRATIPRERNVGWKAGTSPWRSAEALPEHAALRHRDAQQKPAAGVGVTKLAFPGYLRACQRRPLAKAKLSGRKSALLQLAAQGWGRWRLAVPSRPRSRCRMEREGGGGSLFFRGLQNRSHEKMKLRTRKSTLYLSQQKSTGRGGGEWVGVEDERRGGGGKSPALSEGSICWGGGGGAGARNHFAFEKGSSIPVVCASVYSALFCAVLPAAVWSE